MRWGWAWVAAGCALSMLVLSGGLRVEVMKPPDIEFESSALRVGIVGLWTVPFAFQLQRDVIFAAAQSYDRIFGEGNR